VQKIQNQEPIPPSSVRPGLPKSVDPWSCGRLAKKPGAPLPELAEFALELSNSCSKLFRLASFRTREYVALRKVENAAAHLDTEFWELARAGDWAGVAPNSRS